MSAVEVIAVIRDIIIISVLVVAMLIMVFLYWNARGVLKSLKRTMNSVSEITAVVSDKLVKPATAGSGLASGLGKLASAVAGFRGRKKSRGGADDEQ